MSMAETSEGSKNKPEERSHAKLREESRMAQASKLGASSSHDRSMCTKQDKMARKEQ